MCKDNNIFVHVDKLTRADIGLFFTLLPTASSIKILEIGNKFFINYLERSNDPLNGGEEGWGFNFSLYFHYLALLTLYLFSSRLYRVYGSTGGNSMYASLLLSRVEQIEDEERRSNKRGHLKKRKTRVRSVSQGRRLAFHLAVTLL